MNNAKKALLWITDILNKHHIPFQISGGLAAITYGATRFLVDIDIDIPDEKFDVIKNEVVKYIIYGPERFKSDKWDLLLMTLNYYGQEIDLSGVDSACLFNQQTGKWGMLNEKIQEATIRKVYDLDMPIIPREKLIDYKKILGRDVDLIDIAQIENS